MEVTLKKPIYKSSEKEQLSESLRSELGCELQKHLTTTGCKTLEGKKEFRSSKLQRTLWRFFYSLFGAEPERGEEYLPYEDTDIFKKKKKKEQETIARIFSVVI